MGFGEQMGDMNVCDNVLYRCEGSFCLLHGHGTPLERGFVVRLLSIIFLGVDPSPKRKLMAASFFRSCFFFFQLM